MKTIRLIAAALLLMSATMLDAQAGSPVTIQDITNAGNTLTINSDGTISVNAASSPSAASTAGVAPSSTAALAANQIVKASAGNLYSFEASADTTLSAAPWWLMIYNAVSAPADGAVTPAKCYAVPSGTTSFSAGFSTPVYFSTGITIGVSTTGCFTKTASTHAFISGDAK